MLFIEIILFYVLYTLSAPAWCYVLNVFAFFVTSFKMACAIGSFLHGTESALSYEMKNINGEVADE